MKLPRSASPAPLALLLLAFAAAASAQPIVSPRSFLPGDDAVGRSVEAQQWPQISAGGDGYLVVWQDMRPVLSGNTNTPDLPLVGNNWDIYAALLDAQGNVVKSPIVVSQRGKNDTRPRVGWNGSEWLVVWISERPDWYFFEDVVGARISAEGEIIDTEPIMIRPENNDPANDLAEKPWVASDGTDWVIVWEAITWEGFSGDLNLTGRRMLADGTFPEPERLLYQFEGIVFGPENPQIAWAGDQYLLAWEDFGDLKVKRLAPDLRPIDPAPIDITSFGSEPRLATNGTDFMIVTSSYRAYRVTADGVVLDPAGGISFDPGGGIWQPDGPNVAWDGTDWVVTYGWGDDNSEVWFLKIDTDGAIVPPGAVLVQGTARGESQPDLASMGDGATQVAWVEAYPEDIVGRRVEADGSLGTALDLSVGLHRQAELRFASQDAVAGAEHLAVYQIEGDGVLQLVAQRLDRTGGVLDAEPIVLTEYDEGNLLQADVAFDGTRYMVVWSDPFDLVWGQRIGVDGVLIDAFPRILVSSENPGEIAVAGLDGVFLVSFTHTFSGDQRYLKATRVRGDDVVVLDSPFIIGFDFAKEPRAVALGDRWLVVWEDQTNHDQSSSSAAGVFVTAGGSAGAPFDIDQDGLGDDPDVAVLGNRALVVWYDNVDFGDSHVEGRILAEDGSFVTSEFLIASAPKDQLFTRVGTDGEQFVAAWVDYRSNEGIETKRGDVWAARVTPAGDVLDLGGFQVTEGFLPEDLPDVAGAGGRAVLGYSAFDGVDDLEIQRISRRVLGQAMSLAVTGTCPGSVEIDLAGASPFGDVVFVRGSGPGDASVPGGACAGAGLDLAAPTRLGRLTADADGGVSRVVSAPSSLCGTTLQALDLDTCGTSFLATVAAAP